MKEKGKNGQYVQWALAAAARKPRAVITFMLSRGSFLTLISHVMRRQYTGLTELGMKLIMRDSISGGRRSSQPIRHIYAISQPGTMV